VAEKRLSEPRVVDVAEIQIDKNAIGKQFKKDAKLLVPYFEKLTTADVDEFEKRLKSSSAE